MDRAIDGNERIPQERPRSNAPRGPAPHARAAERAAPELSPRPPERPQRPGSERLRKPVEMPDRTVYLSPSERETLTEIGRFRTIALTDLERHRYGGKTSEIRQDLRHLTAEKLLAKRTLWRGKSSDGLAVVTLTRQGKRLLEQEGATEALYAGFVKPRELEHDAAIYRMYRAEAARITKEGGQIRCVILDYELKRRVYSPLAKIKAGPLEYANKQKEVAAENGLKIVHGHIQLPDLRIEYVRSNGERAYADLELATGHYRAGQLSAKAQAGFTFYAAPGSAGRLSAVFEEHEITAEILSL
jgi:hypothetical protein